MREALHEFFFFMIVAAIAVVALSYLEERASTGVEAKIAAQCDKDGTWRYGSVIYECKRIGRT